MDDKVDVIEIEERYWVCDGEEENEYWICDKFMDDKIVVVSYDYDDAVQAASEKNQFPSQMLVNGGKTLLKHVV